MVAHAGLMPARLLKRYKRFLADAELPDGQVVTVHTPNTGSMLGCAEPGMRIWLRDTQDDKRRYRFAWEISETPSGVWIGINTALSNRLVEEAVRSGRVPELCGYSEIRREVPYGKFRSRIDLLLSGPSGPSCYVEVKNVTAVGEPGIACFPDAVTERGHKHLEELAHVARDGARAVLFFCVQRGDVEAVRPADEIDPRYGELLRWAVAAGVEVLAYVAHLSPSEILLTNPVAVRL